DGIGDFEGRDLCRSAIDIPDRYPRSRLGKAFGDRPPDAPRRPGDDGDPAGKIDPVHAFQPLSDNAGGSIPDPVVQCVRSSRHASLKRRNTSSLSLWNAPRRSASVLFGDWYVSEMISTTASAFSATALDERTRIRLTIA